jgi:hypothetical protein
MLKYAMLEIRGPERPQAETVYDRELRKTLHKNWRQQESLSYKLTT